jgi:hypothetical protein
MGPAHCDHALSKRNLPQKPLPSFLGHMASRLSDAFLGSDRKVSFILLEAQFPGLLFLIPDKRRINLLALKSLHPR